MADKRTTAPEGGPQAAPEEPRREKRAGPTIDLTATEEPPPSDAPEQIPPEPPATASEPPPEQAERSPAGAPAAPSQAAFGVVTVVAGAAGGVIVLLVLAALWLSGLLPLQLAASNDKSAQAAANAQAIDALSRRVGALEDAIKKLPPGDAGLADRLTAAENAMKSLGVALAALNSRSDQTATTAAQARERADVAAKAVADLQEAMKTAAPGRASQTDIDALSKRVAALESAAQAARADISKIASASSANDTAARLALSADVLRDAVPVGAPFADELAAVKELGGDAKALAPLASFAASGVPTAQALAQELKVLLPEMAKLSGAQAPQGGFLDRLQANASKLVRIRPINAPEGDDASAVLARLDIDAAKADLRAALADLGKLDSATRAPAEAWIAKVQAREAALAAAQRYAAETARALGQKAGTQ